MAPFLFQAARSARNLGVLEHLYTAGAAGSDRAATGAATGLPATSVAVLLDALLAGGLVEENADGRWRLTTVGVVWQRDPQVLIDADFTADVCWHSLPDLTESLATGHPAGLRRLGPWNTIYEGLASLPETLRRPWFAYDHGHSDRAFPAAIATLLATQPSRVLDVGANTGRFAQALLAADPAVHVTLLDHPGQISEARSALARAGVAARAETLALDLLNHALPFPTGCDAVWMSQFLDCFGPDDVVHLLRRSREALAPGGSVWVLEVCPDRQSEPAAAASLRLASLYFTALANGVSRFYRGSDLLELVAAAGLRCVTIHDGLGTAHSLFRLEPMRT